MSSSARACVRGRARQRGGWVRVDRRQPASLELGHLFVDPGFFRMGVGRSLFEPVVGEARRRGAVVVVIESDPNAEGFYEKLGAELIGTAPSIVDRPVSARFYT